MKLQLRWNFNWLKTALSDFRPNREIFLRWPRVVSNISEARITESLRLATYPQAATHVCFTGIFGGYPVSTCFPRGFMRNTRGFLMRCATWICPPQIHVFFTWFWPLHFHRSEKLWKSSGNAVDFQICIHVLGFPQKSSGQARVFLVASIHVLHRLLLLVCCT